ncbi:MAG: hypothetical protein JO165_05135 [Candidatus Eremiobacteraeota bacterium]|nr:hypothetical protein [Candidatus Eremiobacteraeota bacterium]
MKRLGFLVTVLALFAAAAPLRAQTPPTQYATDNVYEDPAMRFVAPAGYQKVPIAVPSGWDYVGGDDPTTVAAFVKNRNSNDARLITIAVEHFDGPLDGYEGTVANRLRGSGDSVFVAKKVHDGLKNGMPTYWEYISMGSGFDTMHRYQQLWIDTVRGVTVAISARNIDEKEARDALSDLTATAFPRRNY